MILWCRLGWLLSVLLAPLTAPPVCVSTVFNVDLYGSLQFSTRVYSSTFYVNRLESNVLKEDPTLDDVVDVDKGGLENIFES